MNYGEKGKTVGNCQMTKVSSNFMNFTNCYIRICIEILGVYEMHDESALATSTRDVQVTLLISYQCYWYLHRCHMRPRRVDNNRVTVSDK